MFVPVSGELNHNRSAMKKKALAQGPLSMRDHFDKIGQIASPHDCYALKMITVVIETFAKIGQIGLKPALLEKR